MVSLPRALAEILERREQEGRQIRPSRVTRRARDGALYLVALDGTCELRGPAASREIGEVVRLPDADLTGAGASGIPTLPGAGSLAFQWIERLDPDHYQAGGSYTVAAYGIGLTETMAVEFLLPGSAEINPDITLAALELITSRQLLISIEVAGEAGSIVDGDLAYGEPADG